MNATCEVVVERVALLRSLTFKWLLTCASLAVGTLVCCAAQAADASRYSQCAFVPKPQYDECIAKEFGIPRYSACAFVPKAEYESCVARGFAEAPTIAAPPQPRAEQNPHADDGATRAPRYSACAFVPKAEYENCVAQEFAEAPTSATPQQRAEQSPHANDGATRVRMKSESGTFSVPAMINGAITLDFVIDSGASDVSVPADVVLTLMRTGTLVEADFLGSKTYVLADGTRVPSNTFRIKSLKIGDVILNNVLGSVANVRGSLLLGQSFLSRFPSWSIDNVRHELVLGDVVETRRATSEPAASAAQSHRSSANAASPTAQATAEQDPLETLYQRCSASQIRMGTCGP